MRETIEGRAVTLSRCLAFLASGGETVDFMTEFAYPLPIRVICALLGVPAADQHWFREQAGAMAAVLEPSIALGDGSAADEATLRLERYFADLVRPAPRRAHR